MMDVDEHILLQLTQDTTKREYRLYYQDKMYFLEDTVVTKSQMPVNKPTNRGGVYSINDKEYKIKGAIHDLSLVPFISKMMLGPSTQFQEIPVKTQVEINGKKIPCTLFTYLTNAMNNSSKIVFNLLIVRIKIE